MTNQAPNDCPLCGNEVRIFKDSVTCYLACETCDLILQGADRANIIRKWNNRVPTIIEIELETKLAKLDKQEKSD